MTYLTIGGVPEHFNYPWHITLKSKEYELHNIGLNWKDFPGGTGAMAKALRTGEIDIAIVLTEGIIKDIINGNPSKIVQVFVKSPLVWGIHVAQNSSFKSVDDLQGATAAISRFGSGSHLMAIINAYNRGWDIKRLKFKVVKDLQGGVEALTKGEADYFMWEHFTTKPYVDNNIFKWVGDCPTPWPCFVIAVRNEILEKYPEKIKAILNIINSTTDGFKDISEIDKTLSKLYNQRLCDIQKWLSITEWSSNYEIPKKIISDTQNKLVRFGVIESKINESRLIEELDI